MGVKVRVTALEVWVPLKVTEGELDVTVTPGVPTVSASVGEMDGLKALVPAYWAVRR
jgi:hypothetical protein